MLKLRGLIAAPFTPLKPDGSLALSQIGKLARMYEKNAINGAFICGSTGEGASLTLSEKIMVMERWGEEKGQKLSAIFMLGGTCLKEMQELAQCAQKNNMDGIAILSPYYFKPASIAQLVGFCMEVADSAPALPFYYYHIPALTGGTFPMVEFLKAADGQIANLAGIKFTAPDIMDFHLCRMFKEGKYNILWGIDEAMLSGLAAGAEGAVGSTYNYAAPLYNQIIAAFQKGEMAKAEKLQALSVKMVNLLIKYGGTGAGKAFMKIIGLDCGSFRPPLVSPSAKETELLKAELMQIGFNDFCCKL